MAEGSHTVHHDVIGFGDPSHHHRNSVRCSSKATISRWRGITRETAPVTPTGRHTWYKWRGIQGRTTHVVSLQRIAFQPCFVLV
ncbi:hypothetical protein [Akkermansia sp.]